jgi:hypothetical protein
MALTVLPIVSRFSTTDDASISGEWLDRFVLELARYVDDWLPRHVARRSLFDRLKLPHEDAFAFGERLAVVEQGAMDQGALGVAYARITELLASEFRNLESLGEMAAGPSASIELPLPGDAGDDYDYDVFVSYARSGGVVSEWIFRSR